MGRPDNSSSNVRKIKAYDENQKVLDRIAKLSADPQVRETLRAMRDLDANVLRDIDTNVLEAVGDGKTDKARKLYFASMQFMPRVVPARLSPMQIRHRKQSSS